MERLNEIMGRTTPRRQSNPTQPSPYPYLGQDPAPDSSQAEPVPQPVMRRRPPEQASQPPLSGPSTRQDATYPYGNDMDSRPNQQYYNSNSNTIHNQRQSYAQETPDNHFNEQSNSTYSYAEQNEPGTQAFTHDPYRHSRHTAHSPNGHMGETAENDIFYAPNAPVPAQRPQNYMSSHPRQEPYFHHADVNNYGGQPAADVLNDEDDDDEELHMGYGDWEEGNNQTLAYRRSNLESHAQVRQSTGIYEAAPGYIEQPVQSIPPGRSTYSHDTRNDAGDNRRQPAPYGTQAAMPPARTAQPVQNYPGQQGAPSYAPQPTTYNTNTVQGMPMQSGQQRRNEQFQHSQPPRPAIHEQEVAPYHRRTTQPLNPQAITALGRQQEYAAQLNQARMRPLEATQQVPSVPQPKREELYPTPTPHTPAPPHYPVRPTPTRQVPQTQVMPAIQPQSSTLTSNKAVCSRCKGAGYLRIDVPFGHPNFGKPIACECKEAERKEKRRQQLREMSNLDAFRKKTFETFNAQVNNVRDAYQAAREFAQEPDGWLRFLGPTGCGKTHLAAAIANQALNNGYVVLFQTVPDLLADLRASFAPTSTEVYDQLFSKMREAELLILDDLGTQQSSPWANEKLFQLINYRYNMSMPMVITANSKGLQSIDERILSRLSDAALVRTINMERSQDHRPRNTRRY